MTARKLFTMRMSEAERARLELLAEHYGLTSTDVVRMLVKRDADALGLDVPRPKARASKPKKKTTT